MTFDATNASLEPGTLLVEASAGTGKTWTLTALAVRLIAEREVPLERLLLSTFTEAATRELREKLRRRLRDALATLQGERPGAEESCAARWLAELGDTERAAYAGRLAVALALFDRAVVTTLHGLCARLIRETALEGETAPGAEVAPDLSDVHAELVADFWRTRIVAGTEWLARTASATTSPETLLKLWDKAAQAGRDARLEPAPPADVDLSAAQVRKAFEGFVLSWRSVPRDLQHEYLRRSGTPPGVGADPAHAEARHAFAPLVRAARFLLRPKLPAKLRPSPALAAAATALLAALDATHLRLRHEWIAYARAELPARQRSRRVVGFNDLVHGVARALEAGAPLRRRFDAALVDEFQDTDGEQWRILRALVPRDDGLLILVGDPKQAIYAFRGADVGTYLRVRDELRADHRGGAREGGLARSFRSTPAFVAACNTLFGGENPFASPGILYTALTSAREASPGAVAPPLRLRTLDGDKVALATQDGWITDDLARDIAARIAAGEGQPREFAVLVRQRGQGRLVREALAAAGLPAVLRSEATVWESDEARELALVLHAILEAGRAARLKAALLTSWWDATAETLAALEADPEQLESLAARFAAARELWHRHGLAAALADLSRREGLRPRLLSRLDGDRAVTNIDHLVELLEAAARAESLSPPATLRLLLRRRSGNAGDRDAALLRMERDDEAVQILTMHGSKGLEFPHVYVPFAWRGRDAEPPPFASRDADGRGVLHLEAVDDPALAEASLAEECRLLYVAVTRARETCVLHLGLDRPREREALVHLLSSASGAPGPDARSLAQALARAHPDLLAHDTFGPATPRRDGDARVLRAPAPVRAPDPLPPLPEPVSLTFSFSALHQEAASVEPEERSGEETGTPAAPVPATRAGPEQSPWSIHALPAGAATGDFLHDVLEHHDFAAPVALPSLLLAACSRHAVPTEFTPALLTMISALGSTPLAGDDGAWTLAEVPAHDRWNEVGFHLAGARPSGAALAAVLAEHGGALCSQAVASRVATIGEARPVPYLAGAIDCLVRRDGRFHILDWKSNRLGDSAAEYTPDTVARAMEEALYPLQAALYALALHRHLGARLPGYAPELHLGSVHYLFVRGIQTSDTKTGVFTAPIPVALVRALDALLGRHHR